MNQRRKTLIHGAQLGRVPRSSELKNSMEGIFSISQSVRVGIGHCHAGALSGG
jgi:hypothetical protein